MDYQEIIQQAVVEVKEEVILLLKKIEPQVIDTITETVNFECLQKIKAQEMQIKDLQERIRNLEECIAWFAHKNDIQL